MNSKERQGRIREIERTVAKLQEKGWRMESVTHEDELSEPFRTTIRMAVDRESTVKGVL